MVNKMVDFRLQDIDNRLADREISFLNKHPILAPLVSTAGATAFGAVLGHFMPLKQDTFVKYISYEKSDECIELAQRCEDYITLLKSEVQRSDLQNEIKNFIKGKLSHKETNLKDGLIEIGKAALLRVRILLGGEAFNKLCVTFQEKELLKDGEKILEHDAINEKRKCRKELLEEYLKVIENYKDKKLPEIYERAKKQLRKANAKNLATIFGVSALIITGLYSYIKNASKIKEYMQAQENNK